MNLSIVTVSSHRPAEPYFTYDQFYASANRYGFQPIVLADGFGGLGTKPKLLKRAIENKTVSSPHIIFCDSWDLVFARNPNEIQIEPKIVFGAEKKCFPDLTLADKHPECKSPFRYLNCGFSVGPTELYLQALTEMKADEFKSDVFKDGQWTHYEDQRPWIMQYLFGNVLMSLDTNCEIVQNLSDVTMAELDLNKPPIAYHWNGGAKTNGTREPILNHLKL